MSSKAAIVCEAAKAVSSDVIILTESGSDLKTTVAALRENVAESFTAPRPVPGRIQVVTQTPDLDLTELYAGNRITLRRLKYKGTELLSGAVHLVDKTNFDDPNQSCQIQLLAQEIRDHEAKRGHNKTILLGDFNLNPFEAAMHIAPGMNAMMTRQCVERRERTLQENTYPYFYNPMWGLFGDRTTGPAGTYFHKSAARGLYGWNMLDQVLIRPDVLPWFHDVRILSTAGETSLQSTKGRPNKQIASDHFPILVELYGDRE